MDKPIERYTFGNGGVVIGTSKEEGIIQFSQINSELGYVGDLKEGDFNPEYVLYSYALYMSDEDDVDALQHIAECIINKTKEFSITYQDKKVIFDFINYNTRSVNVVLESIVEVVQYLKEEDKCISTIGV